MRPTTLHRLASTNPARRGFRACIALLALIVAAGCGSTARVDRPPQTAPTQRASIGCTVEQATNGGLPPGIVIAHIPAREERYVGSPSIAVLEDGSYLASHDVFGPRRFEPRQTHIYRSDDRGASWEPVAVLEGQFWSGLFVHRGSAYVLGTNTGLGAMVIRRSDDGGLSWSPAAAIMTDGRFHTAPVPVVAHGGRIWRAAEEMLDPVAWPQSLAALLVSAPEDADLLDPASWTRTPSLRFDEADPGDGWMEGNAVVDRDGNVGVFLRMEVQSELEHAAFLRFVPGQNALVRDSVRPFPGGSKKFTVRFDPRSTRYWTLVNDVPGQPAAVPGRLRNRLSIASSTDMRSWTVHATLLFHPDAQFHGFQYADFQMANDDLVFVSRTAYDDGAGGADDFHNANFLTFHRVRDFRTCAERTLASP